MAANPVLVRMLGYPNEKSFLPVNIATAYVDQRARQEWHLRLDNEGICKADPDLDSAFFYAASTPTVLLDNQRGHHPKHPMRRFRVRQDVAVECPSAWLLAINDHVKALPGRDVQRVA